MNRRNASNGSSHGYHRCSFYANRREQWAITFPVLQRGLQQGYKCLYVVEERSPQGVEASLERHDIPVSRYVERGQLLIIAAEEMCPLPAPFSLDLLLEKLERLVRDTQRSGYHGLVIAIEMSWILQYPESLACLPEYEARVNDALSPHPLVLLCQYNLQRFPVESLLDVLKAHPEVQTLQGGRANPFYLPPQVMLQQSKKEEFVWYLQVLNTGRWMSEQGIKKANTESIPQFSPIPAPAQTVRGPAWSPWEVSYRVGQVVSTLQKGSGEQKDAPDSPRRWQIFCFGKLRVYRPDGTQVSWNVAKGAPTKVRTLFAFLLVKGVSGATQERLVDLLWPDQIDFEKGLARLYHTIHCLRRALEPDLVGHRKESRYLLREGGRYFLNLPRNAWIDVTAFEELCYQGEYLIRLGREEDALACYLAAERLYAGDYLADIPLEYAGRLDDDWCWSRRFWLQEMYIKLFLGTAELYLKRGAYREALAYYRKALMEDPTRQEAHQGMMRVFHQAGRRDALARQYRLWQELLHRLGEDAMGAEVAHLYEELEQEFACDSQTLE